MFCTPCSRKKEKKCFVHNKQTGRLKRGGCNGQMQKGRLQKGRIQKGETEKVEYIKVEYKKVEYKKFEYKNGLGQCPNNDFWSAKKSPYLCL
jgi:hypothetical protein